MGSWAVCGQVRDLLGEDPLKRLELKEDPSQGVFVKDLVFVEVASVEAIDRVMRDGCVSILSILLPCFPGPYPSSSLASLVPIRPPPLLPWSLSVLLFSPAPPRPAPLPSHVAPCYVDFGGWLPAALCPSWLQCL